MNWKKLRNNIPSQIQVGKKGTYEVVWVEEFKDPGILGETRFDSKQIAIKLGQSDKETISTVFHEFLHALSAEHNVNLTETQVVMLEKSLHYFLKFVTIVNEGPKGSRRKRKR